MISLSIDVSSLVNESTDDRQSFSRSITIDYDRLRSIVNGYRTWSRLSNTNSTKNPFSLASKYVAKKERKNEKRLITKKKEKIKNKREKKR